MTDRDRVEVAQLPGFREGAGRLLTLEQVSQLFDDLRNDPRRGKQESVQAGVPLMSLRWYGFDVRYHFDAMDKIVLMVSIASADDDGPRPNGPRKFSAVRRFAGSLTVAALIGAAKSCMHLRQRRLPRRYRVYRPIRAASEVPHQEPSPSFSETAKTVDGN